MVDPLGWLARQSPNRFEHVLSDTRIYDYYRRLRFLTLQKEQVTIHACGRSSQLDIPPQVPAYNNIKKGTHEPVLTRMICQQLNEESVFFDIGSNVGYFVRVAQMAGVPSDQIIAFESDPLFYSLLEENFARDDVCCKNRFVSDGSTGTVALDQQPVYPTHMKIDVEGAELEVLQGATSILRKEKPMIFLEYHPEKISEFGGSFDQIQSILLENGYDLKMQDHREESDSSWLDSFERQPSQSSFLIWAR